MNLVSDLFIANSLLQLTSKMSRYFSFLDTFIR